MSSTMQSPEVSSWDIYVAFGQRRGSWNLHWMLMLVEQDAQTCTWYHVVGGPSQNRKYERKIQAGKRIDSHGISKKQWVSCILGSELGKVKSAVDAVRLQPCQRWTVEVLGGLEKKGLVPPGTSSDYRAQMEPCLYVETDNGWVLADGLSADELSK